MSDKHDLRDKRRYPRIETSNLVDYELFDGQGGSLDQGAGRAINLSQTGTLLETKSPMQGAFILLMTFDIDGKKVTVEGRVVRTGPSTSTNTYLTGIEFMGSKNIQREAIITFVKAYQHRKHQNE